MSLISGYPSGLLSLLDAQTQGKAPAELLQSIQPTIDMTTLFAISKQSGVGGFEVAPAAGGFIPMTGGAGPNTVPAGELWFVSAFSILCQSGAGESSNFCPAVRLNGLVTPLAEMVSCLASTTRVCASKFPFLALAAGTEIGAYCAENVLAPTLSTQLIVSRLRA